MSVVTLLRDPKPQYFLACWKSPITLQQASGNGAGAGVCSMQKAWDMLAPLQGLANLQGLPHLQEPLCIQGLAYFQGLANLQGLATLQEPLRIQGLAHL